jgi:ubiquinone/menaquinone biosynthesis C-methylase UbiE
VTAVPTGNAYDKYGTANPIERRIMANFFRTLEGALPTTAPARILEVGAGEGEVVGRVIHDRWPDAPMSVLDLPDQRLAGHWRQRGLQGVFGSATQLPLPARCVDLVLAIEVLEHVDDPAAALGEIARVASGDVVLSVPREPIWRVLNVARGKYWKDLGNTPGHVQHWSTKAFTDLVSQHLEVTGTWQPLPWTLVRARRR